MDGWAQLARFRCNATACKVTSQMHHFATAYIIKKQNVATWMDEKAVLRIANDNQKNSKEQNSLTRQNIVKTFYFILKDVAEKRNGTAVCHLLENQEVQDLNLSSDYKGMCIMIHVWVKRKSLSLWQVPIILEYGLEHGKNGQRLSLLRRLTPPDHPHFTDSNLVFHSGFSAICNAHLCPTTMLFCGTQLLMIISQPRSFIFIIS